MADDGTAGHIGDDAEGWLRALEHLGIPNATLLHQSPYDRGRRVYLHGDRVYKIGRLPLLESMSLRARDLRGEFDLLRRNRGARGLPEAIDFHRIEDIEAAVYAAVDGTELAQLQLGWGPALSVLWQLAAILARLSLRGISHNDIRPQNVLVGEDGLVYLLDFDQATTGSIYRATLRNYLGLRIGVHPVFGSWTTVLKTLLKKLLATSVARATGRLRRSRSRNEAGELLRSVQSDRVLPTLAADASEAVKLLHQAWRLGQKSDANWPGAGVAYYSIEFEGYRFPGERPWSYRWECLRQIIDYKGKRILELGCNMGLLSCSLLREAGASAALCVDGDAEILEAAKMVAGAYGVEPEFRQQNFDELGDWESELALFRPDVVFALSVLNWIEDKDRFIRFLARFPEVVFEGHDETSTEMERFRRVGFDCNAVVGVSERDRAILRCRKSAAETHVAPAAASVASAGGTVSCVITSYNNSDYLKQAVESVVAQTKPVDEIIIADDASTDGSQDLIRSLAAEHQNIRIILREQNLGVARNRDFAIREANGDLVTFLDGDDFFYTNKTEMELRARKTVTDAVACSNIDIVDGSGSVRTFRDVSYVAGRSRKEVLAIFAFRRSGLPRHMLMPKKVYEEVGGIKSKFGLYEDWDLDIRLAARPVRWVWSGCVGLAYRRAPGGLSSAPVKEHHQAMRLVLEENRELIEAALGPDSVQSAIQIVCPSTFVRMRRRALGLLSNLAKR